MPKLKSIIKAWLPFAVVISAFSLLVYAAVQQSLRQGLNDPQIQMAEDAAFALDNGSSVEEILSTRQTEMSRSLAPFMTVFDISGNPMASSGVLNGEIPKVPQGVLDAAKQTGENRVSWQPADTIRIAAVVVPYENGFVLAGRNMREVEQREEQTWKFSAATWILALVTTFLVISFGEYDLKD
jgi:hypothetical protein